MNNLVLLFPCSTWLDHYDRDLCLPSISPLQGIVIIKRPTEPKLREGVEKKEKAVIPFADFSHGTKGKTRDVIAKFMGSSMSKRDTPLQDILNLQESSYQQSGLYCKGNLPPRLARFDWCGD
jgi:hypothetical protein